MNDSHSLDAVVVGLGGMGRALADALLRQGKPIGVWNRSAPATQDFRGRAAVFDDLNDAARASQLVIVCVSDYTVVNALLDDVWPALADTVLCSVGSSSPDESRALSVQAQRQGVTYLDGAIASYPARMGDAKTVLFFSGSEQAYQGHRDTLHAMGGSSIFVGTDPGAAAVADAGWLSVLGGFMIGILQAAAYCDANDVDPTVVFRAIPAFAVEMQELGGEFEPMIAARDYSGDQAELLVYLPVYQGLVEAATAVGVDGSFPQYLADIIGRTIDNGHSHSQFAAVYEQLRSSRHNAAGRPAG